MSIVLRETVESDVPAIFCINHDPLVKPHQYKLTRHDTIDSWQRHLFTVGKETDLVVKCTTILRGDRIIGHITHYHYGGLRAGMCYCGWNLAPEYWGQGIMLIALAQLFDEFFTDGDLDVVISDCFSNNKRCIRLMQKLHYQPIPINVADRLMILLSRRCFHWIRRFMLTAERWEAQRERSSDTP